jgi:hypothetical protein
MRVFLASLAFLLSGFFILGCMAVALDGYVNFGPLLPVMHVAGGVTPVGAAIVMVAIPLAALFFVIGQLVLHKHK